MMPLKQVLELVGDLDDAPGEKHQGNVFAVSWHKT